MFKQIVSLGVILFLLVFCGCADTKIIDGVVYDTRGLIHKVTDDFNPDIEYHIVWGNMIWGVVLSASIVAPIYFFGFSMFEPVGRKDFSRKKGTVSRF